MAVELALAFAREARAERAWEVIVAGETGFGVAEVVRERERLSDPGRRRQLANTLARALDAAERWHQILVAALPPEGVRILGRFAREVQLILTQLRGDQADVRGLALLARFLAGGYGAAPYSGDADTLRRELARITELPGCRSSCTRP